MKTITIYNNGKAVSMFKVKASDKVAKIQAEMKKQSVAIMHKFDINNLTYSVI